MSATVEQPAEASASSSGEPYAREAETPVSASKDEPEPDSDGDAELEELESGLRAEVPTLLESMNRACNEVNVLEQQMEEHTSELQSHHDIVCRLLLEKKKKI